jgi:hypothetical protein
MKKIICVLLAIHAFVLIYNAQNKSVVNGDESSAALSAQFLAGGPIRDLPKASDRVFVIDEGPGLDTGCVNSTASPLRISLMVDRVIDKTSTNGIISQQKAQSLIQKGYLSEFVTISLPVFDVDLAEGEIDKVFLNGFEIGILTGSNDTWKLNEYRVPIWQLKFGTLDPQGGDARATENIIEIQIDVGGDSTMWCTGADWAAASFKTLSPTIFVHGNGSNGDFFSKNGRMTNYFDEIGVPYDNSINFDPPSNSIEANAAQLASKLPKIADRFGVDSFHLIAHSKGGLDTRYFLQFLYPIFLSKNYTILSLTTLGTPHNGSVGADVRTSYTDAVRKQASVEFRNISRFTALANKYVLGEDNDPAHAYLRTDYAAQFNGYNLAGLAALKADGTLKAKFYTISADADQNNSHDIDQESEFIELLQDDSKLQDIYNRYGSALTEFAVDGAYQLMRSTKEARVQYVQARTFFGRPYTKAIINGFPNFSPVGNDVLVTLRSGSGEDTFKQLTTSRAEFTGASGKNHSSIAGRLSGETAIVWILAAEREEGDLK